MAEGSDIDELVDFDEVSYMEETDEDVVDGVEDATVEETEDDKADEPYEELGIDGSGKEQLSEPDQSPIGDENGEGEDKYTALVNEEDKEKHSELLSRPPHGSEVFIGGLPRDVTEEDLTVLCEPIGEIFEVSLMKNKDTGEFQGCAFVAFKTKEDGQRAIEELQNKEFKGKTLRCSLSNTKNRLFIKKIPKSWSADQFKKMIHEVGPGAEIIDLKQDASTPGCNRGFAFVSYYNYACADYAKQKMSNGSFELKGNNPSVSWAYPQIWPDSPAASQVRALYVKNIPDSATSEQLEELFQRHGKITKVVLLPSNDGQWKFAYIHFGERSSALKAVKGTEKYEIDGQMLEVAMAKPSTNKKTEAASYPGGATYPPPRFGFAGNPYGSFGASYRVASRYQLPVTYGSGQIPSGAQTVPMVPPNCQIGYVLQPPGTGQQMMSTRVQPRTNDPPNGSGSSEGRGKDGNRSRRFRPY